MMRITPAVKVSFGLVMLTVCLVMLGELLGFIPDEQRGILAGRKKFSESLAIQSSLAVTNGSINLVSSTLEAIVNRGGDVLSAALRANNGNVIAKAGDHSLYWVALPLDQSTAEYVQVPVFQGQARWGTVEVAFQPIEGDALGIFSGRSSISLLLYLTIFGFIAYWLFIRRTLKELDPGSVIPERVQAAFNALAEGLVIIDEKGQIVLANAEFLRKVEMTGDSLLGRKVSNFNWVRKNGRGPKVSLPWEITLLEKTQQSGFTIRFKTRKSGERIFTVNTSPILNGKGALRGAMVTFDDLTDLEEKQLELKQTINQLETSREELQEKAVELEILATRDSLTGCLNRRAFFSKCEEMFEEARRGSTDIMCIMADIDHFKSINDRFGHATGDKVIQLVAKELRVNARPDDIVGRYGGEEFCIIMPGATIDEAIAIAERFRISIKQACKGGLTALVRVTSSFGVAQLAGDVGSPEELVDRADKALYFAKENGRNRVVSWLDIENLSEGVKSQGITNEVDEVRLHHDEDAHLANAKAIIINDAESVQLRDRIVELEEELAHSQQELIQQMGHDPVTGLPSRLLFNDRVSQALARGRRHKRIAAVVMLEIDLFHRITDALGAVVGDQLLKMAAKRLTDVLRDTDTVTLLGGEDTGSSISRTGFDEFCILLADVQDTDTVTSVVKRIINSMSKSLCIDGHELFISCNAGISLYPHDSDEASVLLENANAARYKAKQRMGKNNLQYYSADINQESYKQLWFESQLHHALRLNEFSLVYQPKVDLISGRITSMEALLRWNSEKLGAVPPSDFIPIAERTGLINDIGRWVIDNACQQAKRWQNEGFVGVSVAVNLSVLQFRQKDLSHQILNLVKDIGLAPEILELEITESAVMSNYSGAIHIIEELHQAGVGFAVDDFGTGYSSLSYLKHLPINTLKIDRSFLSDTVPDQQDELIIRAIIAMGHSMNLRIVAEGVETDKQKQFLERLGCDEIQGYLISKPVAEEEAMELLRQYNSIDPVAGSRLLARR